ncbi:hypothetical protein CMK19_00195 [Candidatus Poribacteria bacterium]|nr:hypothetical protein [Candidatus Poribacteria bacterium]|tara:strand:+ start:4082 stop:4624 length:543 start_codon:yes stop_codon:yes gene_type:complete
MAFKLDGKTLPVDVAFTSNGINYPANWLRLTTLDEKKAIGITEVADPVWYDRRFYWGVDNPKRLVDENAKDDDGNLLKDSDGKQIVNEGLKTIWVKIQKEQARSNLSSSDWYVTRKSEKGTEIPSNIQTYRDAIRTTCTTRETEINAVADVAALKTLIDGTYDSDGKRTAGITLWPEEVD